MTATQTNRIGDVLVEKGLLTQEQLQSAMDKQKQLGGKQAIGEILVSMGLYLSLYLLFLSLTPGAYRKRRYPKWPGALLVTVWWVGVTIALPAVLRGLIAHCRV